MLSSIQTYTLEEFANGEIRIDKVIFKNGDNGFCKKVAHTRGDHYLFIFQKNGSSKLVVDFRELALQDSTILCILPGQVHYGVSVDPGTEAWMVNVHSSFIDFEFRKIFANYYFQNTFFSLSAHETKELDLSISLLNTIKNSKGTLLLPQVQESMINVCIGIFASMYKRGAGNLLIQSRSFIIAKQFHQLLAANYKQLKKTADYAKRLNISAPYLNEAVKKATGLTVSLWIQQTIICEGKRLLQYTESTIKEIAYELGFADHAYFSTYFSKAEKLSPVAFRAKYR